MVFSDLTAFAHSVEDSSLGVWQTALRLSVGGNEVSAGLVHSNGGRIMLITPKAIVAMTIACFGIASSAFAQAFERSSGTGNSLPTYYGHTGAIHIGSLPQQPEFGGA